MVDFEPNVSTAIQRSSSVATLFGMSNLAIPNHIATQERLRLKEMRESNTRSPSIERSKVKWGHTQSHDHTGVKPLNLTLANSGCLSTASNSRLTAFSLLFSCHSSLALFIMTRAVGALPRAFCRSSLGAGQGEGQ